MLAARLAWVSPSTGRTSRLVADPALLFLRCFDFLLAFPFIVGEPARGEPSSVAGAFLFCEPEAVPGALLGFLGRAEEVVFEEVDA